MPIAPMLWASSRKRYACKGHDFNALRCKKETAQIYMPIIAVHAHPAPLRVERDFVQISCTYAYSNCF